MIRKIVTCLMALTVMGCMAETLSLKTLFKEMPDEILPYLTQNNRLDFVDFMASNMKAEVTNELGGKSVMTAITDDSLSIQLNESTCVDMLLLTTTTNDSIITVIKTYSLENDVNDSETVFYTTKWSRIDNTPTLDSMSMVKLKSAVRSLNIVNSVGIKLNKN